LGCGVISFDKKLTDVSEELAALFVNCINPEYGGSMFL
jgi:hypothetical protein